MFDTYSTGTDLIIASNLVYEERYFCTNSHTWNNPSMYWSGFVNANDHPDHIRMLMQGTKCILREDKSMLILRSNAHARKPITLRVKLDDGLVVSGHEMIVTREGTVFIDSTEYCMEEFTDNAGNRCLRSAQSYINSDVQIDTNFSTESHLDIQYWRLPVYGLYPNVIKTCTLEYKDSKLSDLNVEQIDIGHRYDDTVLVLFMKYNTKLRLEVYIRDNRIIKSVSYTYRTPSVVEYNPGSTVCSHNVDLGLADPTKVDHSYTYSYGDNKLQVVKTNADTQTYRQFELDDRRVQMPNSSTFGLHRLHYHISNGVINAVLDYSFGKSTLLYQEGVWYINPGLKMLMVMTSMNRIRKTELH